MDAIVSLTRILKKFQLHVSYDSQIYIHAYFCFLITLHKLVAVLIKEAEVNWLKPIHEMFV